MWEAERKEEKTDGEIEEKEGPMSLTLRERGRDRERREEMRDDV